MKLIASPTSPYVRKVRVVLAEKRIDYDLVQDPPWDAKTKVPDFNPLGKIPVLVMDDGSSLFDSRVIVEYLDAVSPVMRLIPSENRPRIQVKRWEALADGLCDAAAAIVLEKRRVKAQQSPEWIARQEGKMERVLKAMAQELGDQDWCTGTSYNLADIAAGCALGYVSLRFPDINWRAEHESLARLADKLGKRPAFIETAPPPA